MIKGIGVDLVDKERFLKLIKKFGNRIAIKILSAEEYSDYISIPNKVSFLSKRFAAKEALSKALGIGLYRQGLYPKYITIKHDDYGKPYYNLSSKLQEGINNPSANLQLSISDTDTSSIAFAIVES